MRAARGVYLCAGCRSGVWCFQNLFENARYAMEDHGKIFVRVQREENMLWFRSGTGGAGSPRRSVNVIFRTFLLQPKNPGMEADRPDDEPRYRRICSRGTHFRKSGRRGATIFYPASIENMNSAHQIESPVR